LRAIPGSGSEQLGNVMADRRLLFFGDSLVAGVGDPTGAGWVGRVVAGAFASGLALTAYNLGVRGETSGQVASRWRAEALPRLWPGADCRIVVSFGANDTSVEHGRVRVEADRSLEALASWFSRTGGLTGSVPRRDEATAETIGHGVKLKASRSIYRAQKTIVIYRWTLKAEPAVALRCPCDERSEALATASRRGGGFAASPRPNSRSARASPAA
jgi:hypothetical protein